MVRVPDWQLDALCAEYDKAQFFSMNPPTISKAKQVCERCPVKAECLAFAYETEAVGVWGGTTTGERKRGGQVTKP